MTEQQTVPLDIRSIGTPHPRVDGVEKVTGRAAYAVEHEVPAPLHAWLVTSRAAKGRITGIDAAPALGHPGVVSVLDHRNAPRLADTSNGELAVLQDDRVHFHGQVVAIVLAETSEAARAGAALVEVRYDEEPFEAELREDNATYRPDSVNPDMETDTE
jgi:xanthine dehydrogenase YagR molybdenum-binding subunit